MRRHLLGTLILLIGFLSVSLTGIVAQDDTGTDRSAGVLQLVDSDPLPGEEIDLRTPIMLYFDRILDCDTAEAAFSIEPDIAGDLTCSETALTFTPSTDFARATTYTVSISTDLVGADGAQLPETLTVSFQTVGALQVTEVLPGDGEAVDPDAVITVIFNRPVVPLVIAEDMGDLPDPLSIEPAVEGQGEWLNTSIYVFRPDPAFAGGTTYTIMVNAGLTASDGAVLETPFTWSFSTLAPQVIEVIPQALASDVLLDTTIQVRFNQPMDRASVESAFFLNTGEAYAISVTGTFEWADDNAGFRFIPDDLLPINSLHVAGLEAGVAQPDGGGAPLAEQVLWQFETVPYPAIIGTNPADGDIDISPFTSVTLNFASPMNTETLEERITISPEPWLEAEFYYSEFSNSLTLSFPIEPSTDYTITVAPGMEDVYGNAIDTPFTFGFSTEAYPAEVRLNVPGPVGFYNGQAEDTRLFVTHRNVSEVDFELFSVPMDVFVRRVTGDNSYDPAYGYLPSTDQLLRSWYLPANVPQNVLRYDLIDLNGDGVGDFQCMGALPTRLNVGDTAIVISDPDPVRARSAPPDGEIVELLYRDYSLPVVGGPACVDGIIWWEVTLRDGSDVWVAEGVGEEYFLDLRVDGGTAPVEIVSGDGPLTPGIYFLRVGSPETDLIGYDPQGHFLVVGTANLLVKASLDEVLVWATDVQTGESIAGAPISIYDQNYSVVGQGTTDERGLARITTSRFDDMYVPRVAVLNSGDYFGMSTLEWSDGINPWNFQQNYSYFPQQYRAYLYSDRPIYRPGQPVYFRGIVREMDDVSYTPAALETVPITIYDDRGEVVFQQDLPLTRFGTFSGQFDLADDAVLGYYNIDLELPSRHPFQREGAGLGFSVAEYRLPEFQVDVLPEADAVVQGETITVTVDSRYFFGGTVSNAQVEYSVVAQPYFFQYEGSGYYNFTDFNPDGGPGEFYGFTGGLIMQGMGTTDAGGMLVIEVPAELEDATQSYTFSIEAVVTDESQQAVAGRTEVIVHQGEVYIGMRPETYVSTADEETGVEVISVDWESEAVADQSVQIEVVERRWSNVQERDEAGRTTWTWEVEEIPVTSGEVMTNADGEATYNFTPPNGGVFKVTAVTRDSLGNEVRSSTTIWVASREYVSWRQQNSHRIDLISDQTDYNVGDTAQILITSPFQGTTQALITVERGDVIEVEQVTMDSNSYIYELPIIADYSPNVFVSVVLVHGVDETNPVAAFRMGMIQLGVDTSQRELHIEITPDREQAGPRETVTYTVRTTDYQGNPVSAEVGVAVTDLASLSIGVPNSGPLLTYFYGEQGIGVRTATALTINTDELTQTTLDTIKGGGGGFGEGGILDIRGNFVDTAYWNGAVVTNDEGIATFSVTLPDNLTTWRLDARAITLAEDGNMLVGQNTFDLISSKPLLIRPVTPRFFVVDDEVILAAVVNNNTDSELTVNVLLEAEGVTINGDSVQQVTIPAGGSQRVTWPVTVGNVEHVILRFATADEAGEYNDASISPVSQDDEGRIPVYRYEAPETVSTGGVLRDAGSRTESIVLPGRFEVTQGELTINVDQSLAGTAISSLDYIRNYRYQSTEWTVSLLLPNVMTYRALNNAGIERSTLEQNLTREVNIAVQRLYAQQHVDGGWGWFVQDSSNPLVTAYAVIGLHEARAQGFAVDNAVIERAQGYLRTQFIVPGLNQPQWRMNRQAFILYAMARSGAPDIARTVELFENRGNLAVYARAYLALAFYYINPDDTSRSDVLISELQSEAIVSATGTHWEEAQDDYFNWNTDTRTTALVLDAYVLLRPQSDLVPNIVRWLMVARRADAWETTQETAWAVMALTDWMVATGELRPDYSFGVTFNGESLSEGTASVDTVTETQRLVVEVADMLADEANQLVVNRSEGNGILYYTAYLRVFLPVPEIEPLNRGIIIERRYTLLDDPDTTTITEAAVGQVVQVRLTIIAPNDLHYVTITDPIPAGADAINPDLETSQQVGTRPGLATENPLSRGWGWWWFSSIRFEDEQVVLSSTYLPAGTYEYVYTIRPGIEGVYNVIPPTGQEVYFPEVYGRGAGSTFTIVPAED